MPSHLPLNRRRYWQLLIAAGIATVGGYGVFALFPKHTVTWPLLWLIAQLLPRVIAHHLAAMARCLRHGQAEV